LAFAFNLNAKGKVMLASGSARTIEALGARQKCRKAAEVRDLGGFRRVDSSISPTPKGIARGTT
jgi:hypothetical protein